MSLLPSYAHGRTVPYRLVPTGRGPSEVVERLGIKVCPSCGADWTARGSLRVGYAGRREYLCWTCMTVHSGQLVDDRGGALPMDGWGLARQHRCEDRNGRNGRSP